jgi:hypothetical protein
MASGLSLREDSVSFMWPLGHYSDMAQLPSHPLRIRAIGHCIGWITYMPVNELDQELKYLVPMKRYCVWEDACGHYWFYTRCNWWCRKRIYWMGRDNWAVAAWHRECGRGRHNGCWVVWVEGFGWHPSCMFEEYDNQQHALAIWTQAVIDRLAAGSVRDGLKSV